MKKRTTGILIGIVCLLLLAGGIGSYVVQHLSHAQKIAVIYQDDTVVRRSDLNAVTESYTITISGEGGAENVIRVSPGSICMESASCPDHLCVKQGSISDGILPIVCLPNHVRIQITGDEEGERYDA